MTSSTLDHDVFGQLYQEYHPRVLAICRQMLGSLEQAEDAANDVFTRLPTAIRSYDPAQPFSRWIAKVAGNHCVDLLRKRQSENRVLAAADPASPEPAATACSPVEELLSKEQREAVRDAVFALPERYLVPLVMRYFSDLSYEEIARTLHTRRTNVAVLIFRAKQQLRKILANQNAEFNRKRSKRKSRRLGGPRRDPWLCTPVPLFGFQS